jgi:hypothetical protein
MAPGRGCCCGSSRGSEESNVGELHIDTGIDIKSIA